MLSFPKDFRILAITLLCLSGCSSNFGGEYPDLYDVKKISSDVLTKEQAAEQIRKMQDDGNSHDKNAENKIKSDI